MSGLTPEAASAASSSLAGCARSRAGGARLREDRVRILNSQPTGFYRPAQLVQDAQRHSVTVLPVDVLRRIWDCPLPATPDDLHTVRLDMNRLGSHDWYRQNPAVELLENMGPTEVGGLDPATQVALGNNLLQAAEGTAKTAEKLLSKLASGDAPAWPAPFIGGIVTECFVNERDEVRFKDRAAADALRSLRRVSTDEREEIVRVVTSRLGCGRPKDKWTTPEARDEMAALVRRVSEEDPSRFAVLDDLALALDALPLAAA